jgi:hypothetical protein
MRDAPPLDFRSLMLERVLPFLRPGAAVVADNTAQFREA